MHDEIRTVTGWQVIGRHLYEYACDYYYRKGVWVGQSQLYYTGKYR